MRKALHQQLPLTPVPANHVHAKELAAMSNLLDALPEAVEIIHAELIRGSGRLDTGRDAMTAEQVLRCLIIKQMNDFSYEDLAFHMSDSLCYRHFCRLQSNQFPKRSTLQNNIKRVRQEALERVNQLVVLSEAALKIEKGRKVRVDSTVTETNIHPPTDSSLLWDCVRVLCRNLRKAREKAAIQFTDHTRRAKRRHQGIQHARSKDKRVSLYRDLLKVTEATVAYAENAADVLDKAAMDLATLLSATCLRHFAQLARQVIGQTRCRVIDKESVPVRDKIVSIFETHTDIIVKDRRETLYGHKLCLTTGASGLILDCVIDTGNPADAKLAPRMIERQTDLYGRPPRQAAFDGGFASKDNLAKIKAMNVEDVAFSKRRGLEISEMVKSRWVYRRLNNFRAGIESGISFLKRVFGMSRCTWRGLPSFRAYAWASILSANLLIIARSSLI